MFDTMYRNVNNLQLLRDVTKNLLVTSATGHGGAIKQKGGGVRKGIWGGGGGSDCTKSWAPK